MIHRSRPTRLLVPIHVLLGLAWLGAPLPPGDDPGQAGSPRSTMRSPIDSSLFVADGPDVRSFVRETTIPAPVGTVYRAWSDGESWRRAYDAGREELRAEIELAVGGRYEWLWDGRTGSNGCQVLSYVPDRMLSFSWNAPPTQPESRGKRTWVVVEFEEREERETHVRLTHLGFGEGPSWDETMAYFGNAWTHVLSSLREGLSS